ncbi:MAG: hypothetical protein QM523_08650 [Candidatus Pacebacteria bacterium]|nr:hypothetical protein [Candidatus Paceibacterota bacterium]
MKNPAVVRAVTAAHGDLYQSSVLGLYQPDAEGKLRLIHVYSGQFYSLSDIVEFLDLGELVESPLHDDCDEPGLELDSVEIAKLASLDLESLIEHPSGFVQMCRDIALYNSQSSPNPVIVYANF